MPLPLAYPWQAAALVALIAIWAALLFGGFVFGGASSDRTRRMPAWTRLCSSLTLVVTAWLWYAFMRGLPVGSYALLIAVGMTCGLLGDLVLAGVIPLAQPVVGGIAAFGLGHCAYLVAVVWLSGRYGLDAPLPRWGMLALWLLLGLSGWYFVVYRGQRATVTHWAALPYTLLLASVAGLFSGLALQSPAFALAAVGAILFLVSDLILATQLFRKNAFPLIGDVVWLTYGPGQALIVASVIGALQLAHLVAG